LASNQRNSSLTDTVWAALDPAHHGRAVVFGVATEHQLAAICRQTQSDFPAVQIRLVVTGHPVLKNQAFRNHRLVLLCIEAWCCLCNRVPDSDYSELPRAFGKALIEGEN
jgi:hypothetical protein